MKTFTTLTLFFCAATAMANPQGGPPGGGQGGRPPGPPQEFFDACKGKAAGTVVQVKTPRGDTIKATCQMVAVPEQRK